MSFSMKGAAAARMAEEAPLAASQARKLIIQIPCYNEGETLAIALSHLPKKVVGFDKVEWLIIDDGSSDDTAEVAKHCGVDHIVKLPRNKGLAVAYMAGLEAALKAGADVVVNTDADNQYCADDIPQLVRPIIEGRAEMVVGARPIGEIGHFSAMKKFLQVFGSSVMRRASGTDVADAPSGFRALSRAAALQTTVYSDYTYTMETIIHAGKRRLAVISVPVRVNEDLRPSRLVKSIRSYVFRNGSTILRFWFAYHSPRLFYWLALAFLAASGMTSLAWIVGAPAQSADLAMSLAGMAVVTFGLGVISDSLLINRRLLEENRRRLLELSSSSGQFQEAFRD